MNNRELTAALATANGELATAKLEATAMEAERDNARADRDVRVVELTAVSNKLVEEQGFHAEEQRRCSTLERQNLDLKARPALEVQSSWGRDIGILIAGMVVMAIGAFAFWPRASTPQAMGVLNQPQGFNNLLGGQKAQPQLPTRHNPKFAVDPRLVPQGISAKDAELLKLRLTIAQFEASGMSPKLIAEMKEELMRTVLNLPRQ